MSRLYGFTYEEWMRRAAAETDPAQVRYKLGCAREAADTDDEVAWVDACSEAYDPMADESTPAAAPAVNVDGEVSR